MEYQLLGFGLDIRQTGAGLSWRRLRLVIEQAIQDPTSIVYRDRWPDRANWPASVQLLAGVLNSVQTLVWHNTKDGQSKSPQHRPTPVLPPWVKPTGAIERKFGTASMTIGAMRKWLGW